MSNLSRDLYINPKELLQELKLYKQTNTVSNELGLILMKIARRFASKSCFSGYSFRDEFIGDAVYRMVEQIGKVRISVPGSNPFSYLTQICYNCFIAKIAREKKYSKLKDELIEDVLDDVESEENISFKKNKKEIFSDSSELLEEFDATPIKKKRKGGYLFCRKKKNTNKQKATDNAIIKQRKQRKQKKDRIVHGHTLGKRQRRRNKTENT